MFCVSQAERDNEADRTNRRMFKLYVYVSVCVWSVLKAKYHWGLTFFGQNHTKTPLLTYKIILKDRANYFFYYYIILLVHIIIIVVNFNQNLY